MPGPAATDPANGVAMDSLDQLGSFILERLPGAVLSREQLREKLYAWGDEVESNTIEVFVHSLRKRLGADYIVTVRGVGYAAINEP